MSEPSSKIILISGASSGIGEACARRFAREGHKLVLLARRLPRLQALKTELLQRGASLVHPLEADVREFSALEQQLNSLPNDLKKIDVLINNAGLSRGLDALHEGSLQDWNEMIDTNIKGLLHLDRLVVPTMVKRGSGIVIHIGSIAGREVYPKGNVYCATKHAVDALTKGLRKDLLGTGVRVSTVDPGLVETEFSQVRFRGNQKKAETVYQNMTPLTGEDVAESVYWVASQPKHVQIAEILILPTDQASATLVHRSSSSKS